MTTREIQVGWDIAPDMPGLRRLPAGRTEVDAQVIACSGYR